MWAVLKNKTQVRRWGIVLLSLLVVTGVTHVVFVAPAQRDVEEKEKAWQSARRQATQMVLYKEAAADLATFFRELPERKDFSTVVTRLEALAKQHHLTIPSVTYDAEDLEQNGLMKIAISFQVRGKYEEIRRFLYDLERLKGFFTVDHIALATAGSDENLMALQMKMASYLKTSGKKT